MIEKIYNKLKNNKKYFYLFAIILTLISSINLFHPKIIFNHDINFHLHRILALTDNIRIHKYIPVYYNYLNGFGYGNGLFYPDIFLYIPAFLKYIGINIEMSYKLFIILINFFSLISIYLCIERITKEKKSAYVGMILYACSLYRLIDLVERGAVGEILAFVFIPLVILGIYEVLYGDYKKCFFITIGLSGLCLSHVISFYLTIIFLVILIIGNIIIIKDKKRLIHLIINIILSMLITIFFWLPMIEQLLSNQLNILNNSQIYNNIIPFYILLADLPISYIGDNWFPSGIGLTYYIGIIIYIKKCKHDNPFIFSIFILGLASIVLSSTKFIWKIDIFYKIFSIVQFPWRFYMFATIFLLIIFCYVIKYIRNKNIIKIILIYTVLIYMMNAIAYLKNTYIEKICPDEIMMGEYLPTNFDKNIINNYKNNNIEYKRNNEILEINVIKKKQNVELPLIYYKGYKVCNNEKCFKISKSNKGLVNVNTNNELAKFNVSYSGTRIYIISKYISILGLILFILYKYALKNSNNLNEKKVDNE